MQTFLPYKNFKRSAQVLDRQRLGNQRVEGFIILKILLGEGSAWKNHPAVKMWRGYEAALVDYLNAICDEWKSRGYKDTMKEKINNLFFSSNLPKKIVLPPFAGNREFHKSHKSNLLRKNRTHYSKYFPNVPDDLPYVWMYKNN
jgi:hypothetical protein